MRRNKKELLLVIPVIILVMVLGISIPLIIRIEGKMEDSASKNLLNATYVIESSVTLRVKNDINSLTNFMDADVELNAANLKVLCSSRGFLRITLIGRDGTGYNCDGEQTDVTEMGIDNFVITSGKPGVSRWYYGHTGKRVVTFGVPVMQDGVMTGALYAERSIDDYYSDINFSFYEGAGRGYLVDAETGKFILKSLQTDGLSTVVNNLFDNLKESGNSDGLVSSIERAMAEGKTGTVPARYHGNESYLCFTPVEANDNWYMVTIVGRTDLMAESVAVRNTIVTLLVIVMGGLNIAFVLAFLIAWKRKKESERKKREALLESITSTVDHVFAVYDPETQTVEYVSENLNRLFGLDSGQAQQNVDYLFDCLGVPKEDSYRTQFIDGTLQEHYVREHEVFANGQMRWVKSEVSLNGDGKYVAVLTDFTKDKEYARTLRIAMQNAENANRAKSEFLSSMSHDIRTPMNGIIGMTAIAAAHAGDEARVKDCLKKIADASAHLLNLINEVLDMSKIESGKVSLNSEAFNLADFMHDLIQMNRAAIDRKAQELSIHVTKIRHEAVVADQVKLQQVMTNIVSNANKYTPNGGRIQIELMEKAGNLKGYGCYEFVCRDNGIGMSRAFVQKIFEPFERAQEPAMRGVQGTGLGMAIVKNIVDLMGGIIRVNSVPGEGTAITVLLNLQLQKEEGAERLPRLPVLVVDDDEVCCLNTTRLVEEIGMAGEWVLTGEEAVEKCVRAQKNAADYFAVLLDWKMPGMDGIETARQIRSRVGSAAPNVILTAYNYEQIESEARQAGVTAFLPKPLFKSKLYHKLRHLLQNDTEEQTTLRNTIGDVHFEGKRILLVEDNELNMEIAVNILEFTRAEIESAFDGEEAVGKYRSNPAGYYDLILMDIQMPVMNGYEATRAIRGSGREDAHTLPIIAMTANAFLEDRERAREAGMDGYIAKPIDVQELAVTLHAHLGREEDL